LKTVNRASLEGKGFSQRSMDYNATDLDYRSLGKDYKNKKRKKAKVSFQHLK